MTQKIEDLKSAMSVLEAKNRVCSEAIQNYVQVNIELKTANILLTAQINDGRSDANGDIYTLMTRNAELQAEVSRLKRVVAALETEIVASLSESEAA